MAAGGKQAGFDRPLGHAERARDLLYRQVVEVVQHDHRAALFVQRVQRFVQLPLLVRAEYRGKRALAFSGLEKFRDRGLAPGLAAVFPRRAGQRPEQPRPELRPVFQRADRPRRGHERLLRQVLAVRTVAGDQAGHAVGVVLVSFIQFVECLHIAALHPPDQFFIRHDGSPLWFLVLPYIRAPKQGFGSLFFQKIF